MRQDTGRVPSALLWSAVAAFALLAASGLAAWVSKGRPHHYPDAPQGKLACISYTPRSDSTASTAASVRAQIEVDLKQLATRTRCVRTYSVLNGLDYVPAVARRYGLRVLLGVWIGSNDQVNEQELTRAIAVAEQDKDVIDAIVVGNEVLLRREQKADALAAMLRRVHEATGVPVTYADVWDFWLKNPQLATAVSFITIHILPYWEDEPIGVEAALRHVENIYDKVQGIFPDQRIFLGETGWPSAGRQREAARPSLPNQARFFREFVAYADAHQLPYNFIEAYDQSWKRRLEGTVGGYWGVFDVQGAAKFPLVGAVIEDARWWRGLLGAGIGALLALCAAHFLRWAPTGLTKIVWCLAGLAAGVLVPFQWTYLWQGNRNALEWTATVAWCLLGYAVFLSNLRRLTFSDYTTNRIDRYVLLAFLIGAVYVNIGLSFDARYRDFPTLFIILPTLALLLRGAATFRQSDSERLGIEELMLAWFLALPAPWIAFNEKLTNTSALYWCMWSLLLALPLLAHFHVHAREYQHADQKAERR